MRIARPLPRGRGRQFAKPGSVAESVVSEVERIQAEGPVVSHFRVNADGDAITQIRGTWVLLAHEGDLIEF